MADKTESPDVEEPLRPFSEWELIRNMEHRADLFDQLRQDKDAAFLREKIAALIQAAKWAAAS